MISAAGLALAERHRLAQGQVAKTTAQQMLTLWPILVAGGRLDENIPRWLLLAQALITLQRRQSAALAVQFATALRFTETGTLEGFTPRPAVEPTIEAVRTSLMVLGPTSYKREISKQLGKDYSEVSPVDLQQARLPQGIQAKLAANGARAAMRHVQNGARETFDNVMADDAQTVGYFRATSADPCYFCAMLASRGPVYDDDSFADSDPRFHGPGNQKVHDACGCMLLPMYRRPATTEERFFIDQHREYDALWRRTGSIQKFREAFEGRATG